MAFGQNLIVTAQGTNGVVPELSRDDVAPEVNHRYAAVHDFLPLRGTALDLYIAIDGSGANGNLRSFVDGQPAATRIGIAYLHDGTARIAAPLTSDRRETEEALRANSTRSGGPESPYAAISDLIHKWPSTNVRREILYVGSGADSYSGNDPDLIAPATGRLLNLHLESAIADAQRAGIPVFSIYVPANVPAIPASGRNYLADLTESTGGQIFMTGSADAASLPAALKAFSECLSHQYLLVFDADARRGFNAVDVLSQREGVSLAAATKVYYAQG